LYFKEWANRRFGAKLASHKANGVRPLMKKWAAAAMIPATDEVEGHLRQKGPDPPDGVSPTALEVRVL